MHRADGTECAQERGAAGGDHGSARAIAAGPALHSQGLFFGYCNGDDIGPLSVERSAGTIRRHPSSAQCRKRLRSSFSGRARDRARAARRLEPARRPSAHFAPLSATLAPRHAAIRHTLFGHAEAWREIVGDLNSHVHTTKSTAAHGEVRPVHARATAFRRRLRAHLK